MPASRVRPLRVPLAALLVALSACAPLPVGTSAPKSEPPAAEAPPVAPSTASEAARQHYARIQADLLARGLMRTDGGVEDAPYTDRMLADNFVRIALYDEYARSAQGLVATPVASRLRRWEQPVHVSLRFGASVPADRQATDRARISSFLARLQSISGHPIRLTDVQPNFFVYIVNEDERRALGPVIRPACPASAPSTWRDHRDAALDLLSGLRAVGRSGQRLYQGLRRDPRRNIPT